MADEEKRTPGPGEVGEGTPSPEDQERLNAEETSRRRNAAKKDFEGIKRDIDQDVKQELDGNPGEEERWQILRRAHDRLNTVLGGDTENDVIRENARRASYRTIAYLEKDIFPHIDDVSRAALVAVAQSRWPGKKSVMAAELVNKVVGKMLTEKAYDLSGKLKEALDEMETENPDIAITEEFMELKQVVENAQLEAQRKAAATETIDQERHDRIRRAWEKMNHYRRKVAGLSFSEEYEYALLEEIQQTLSIGADATDTPIDRQELFRKAENELNRRLEAAKWEDFSAPLDDLEYQFAMARTPEQKEQAIQTFIEHLGSPEMRRKYGREEIAQLINTVSTKEFKDALKGGKGNPESVISALEQARFSVEGEDRELIESMGKPEETLRFIAKLASEYLPPDFDDLDDSAQAVARSEALREGWKDYYGKIDAFTQRILSNTAAKHDEQFRMNMYEESAYKGIQTLVMAAGGHVSTYLEGLPPQQYFEYQGIKIGRDTVFEVEEFDKKYGVRVERKPVGVAINEWLANRVISSKDQVTAIHNITYGISQGAALEDLEKYAKQKLSSEFVQRLQQDPNVALASNEWMSCMHEQIARNGQQIPDDFGMRDESGYDAIDREAYNNLLSMIPRNSGETIPQHRNRVAQAMRKGIVVAWAFDADALHAMKHAKPKQSLKEKNGDVVVEPRAQQTHSSTYLAVGSQLIPFFYHWLYRSPPTMNWLTSMYLPRDFDEYLVDGGPSKEKFGVDDVLHAQQQLDNARMYGASEWLRREFYDRFALISEAIDPQKMGATQTGKLGNAERITLINSDKLKKSAMQEAEALWEARRAVLAKGRSLGHRRVEDFPDDLLQELLDAERAQIIGRRRDEIIAEGLVQGYSRVDDFPDDLREALLAIDKQPEALGSQDLIVHMDLLRRSGSGHVYNFIQKNLGLLAKGYVDPSDYHRVNINGRETGDMRNERLVGRQLTTLELQEEYIAAEVALQALPGVKNKKQKGERRRKAEVRFKRAERALLERLTEVEVTQRMRDSMPSVMVTGEKQVHMPDYEEFHGMGIRPQLHDAIASFELNSGETCESFYRKEGSPEAEGLVRDELFNVALRAQRLAETLLMEGRRKSFDDEILADVHSSELSRKNAQKYLSADSSVFTLSVYDQIPKRDQNGEIVYTEAGEVQYVDSPIAQAVKDLYRREASISRGPSGVSFEDIFSSEDEFLDFMKHYGSHLQAAIGDVHQLARRDLPEDIRRRGGSGTVRYKFYSSEHAYELGADHDISLALKELRIAGVRKPVDLESRAAQIQRNLAMKIAERSEESDSNRRKILRREIEHLKYQAAILERRGDQVSEWVSAAIGRPPTNRQGYELERDSQARRLAYLLIRNEGSIRTEVFDRDRSNTYVDLTVAGGNFGAKQLGHGKFEAAAIEEENKIWLEEILVMARRAKNGGENLESSVEKFVDGALGSLMKKWYGKDFEAAPVELMKRLELVKRFIVRKPSSQVKRLPFTSRDAAVAWSGEPESVIQLALPSSKERPILAASLGEVKEVTEIAVKKQKDVNLEPHEVRKAARLDGEDIVHVYDPASSIAERIAPIGTKAGDVARDLADRLHAVADRLEPSHLNPQQKRGIRREVTRFIGDRVDKVAMYLPSQTSEMEYRVASILRKVPGLKTSKISIPYYERTKASYDLLQRVQGTKAMNGALPDLRSRDYIAEKFPMFVAGGIGLIIALIILSKELGKDDV